MKQKPLPSQDVLDAFLASGKRVAVDLDFEALVRQLLEGEQQARLTAETLLRATAAINSTLELGEVLDLILEQLQQMVRFDSASVMLIDDGCLRVLAVRGHPYPEAALQVAFTPQENPLAQEILDRRECLVLADAQADPRFSRYGDAGYVRGWMGIPLVARDQVTGLLTIDSREPQAYSKYEARLAQVFASQAALAVNNARLYEGEREQRALAQALREITLVLSGSLKADVILGALLEQVAQVVAYDSARVMLVEGDQAHAVAHRGYDRYEENQDVVTVALRVDSLPNLRLMAQSLRAHFVSDVQQDPNWVMTGFSRHFGSWLGAPLVAHGRLLGFLSLEMIQPGAYKARHAARLEILAGHIALALLNALTYGEMERASVTDYLTGTYNHRYFQQQLRREIELAQRIGYPVSLLMLDLDHFKEVNDSHGHLAGDRVLQILAGRLKGELRGTDHLARYGGEEFAVILPGTPAAAALEVAERLRRAVGSLPFRVEESTGSYLPEPDLSVRAPAVCEQALVEITVTVSIGAATFPAQAGEPRDLVAAADRALYVAKNGGRDRVCSAAHQD